MPADSCIRSKPEDRLAEEKWSLEHDLLSLLVEVTSVPAAGMQLKKPITLKRPGKDDKAERRPEHGSAGDTDAAFKRGISVLAGSAKAVNHG